MPHAITVSNHSLPRPCATRRFHSLKKAGNRSKTRYAMKRLDSRMVWGLRCNKQEREGVQQ